MNPVWAKLVSKPEEWEFSSAKDYLGYRNNNLISKEEICFYFDSKEHIQEFLLGEDDFDYNKFRK